jgi:hypothetical protein
MSAAKTSLGVLTGAAGLLCIACTLNADPPAPPAKGKPAEKSDDEKRVSVAVARDRAKLLHDVYSTTLDSMHRHFFRREGAVLPARALDDVFAEVDRKTKIKSRWIAVNTPAMSISHEPETAFEKKAAAELADGKAEYESTDKGEYLRATPIPLGAGCVGCHTKFGATDNKKARFAGLVVSIPVKDE